jgi:hypothetical protein
MARVSYALAAALAAYVLAPGTTNALPIAPLPAGVTTDASDIVPVYYWRGRYYPYRWHGGYYRYRWHGGYYRHRYYRYRHWRYW